MQTTGKKDGLARRQAFTLIELMVVVVVISILIAGVFKLMSVTSINNKRAQTLAKMERIQNALSGFYALYGTYPPVEQYGSPDPFGTDREDDFGDTLESRLDARSAAWASKCQPIAFEFPNSGELDEFVGREFSASGINQTKGGTANSSSLSADWEDVKIFKFGLLSYLLPRIEVIGIPQQGQAWGKNQPNINFYKSNQWKKSNLTSKTLTDNSEADKVTAVLQAQRKLENDACARWLPNFEKIIYGGVTLLGINTDEAGLDDSINYRSFRRSFVTDYNDGRNEEDHCKTDGKYYAGGVLRCMTIRDGWNQEFYYHSDPPYQSYRIWSAGPNGSTFPPWIPINSLQGNDRQTVVEWTQDDICGFDR